jgi:uncharacterized protein (DUF302 family)
MMDALVVVESDKSLEEACRSLERAVAAHDFGVLHVHDIRQSLAKKGVPFDREVKVFDICNPRRARDVLEKRVELAALLPCSIAVFSIGKRSKFCFVLPSALLGLSGSPDLEPLAREVEQTVRQIVAAAAS